MYVIISKNFGSEFLWQNIMRRARVAAGRILAKFYTASVAALNFVQNARAKEPCLMAQSTNVVRVAAQKLTKTKTPFMLLLPNRKTAAISVKP
jgi:hypothetical protein